MESGKQAQARGRVDEARRQFDSALKSAESFPDEDPRKEKTLRLLAGFDAATEKLAEAEDLYKRLLVLDEKNHGKDAPAVVRDLAALSSVYRKTSRFAEAEALARKALELTRSSGRKGKCLIPYLLNLAAIYQDMQKSAEARELLEEATTIATSEKDSDTLFDVLLMKGRLLAAEGKYSRAEPVFRKALSLKPDNHEVALELASILETMEDFTGAAKVVEESFKNDDGSPVTVEARIFMAELARRKHDGAVFLKALNSAAAQVARFNGGRDDERLAALLRKLGNVYLAVDSYDQAESRFKKALRLDEKFLGKESPVVAQDMNLLGTLYLNQGQYDLAASFYQNGYDITRAALGEDHPDTATCLNNLALLETSLGHYPEAEKLLARGLRARENSLGAESPIVALSLENLADVLAMQGKFKTAEPLLLRALQIQSQNQSQADSSTASLLRDLARIQRQAGKVEDCKDSLGTLLKLDESLYGADSAVRAHDLDSLADLLLSKGEKDEAAKLKKESARIKLSLPGHANSEQAMASADLGNQKTRPVKDKWALVIGISKFKDSSINLRYAAKDATDFRNYLVEEAGFAKDHVKLLTDKEATRDGIVSHLGESWLGKQARRDDLVVIYISSHGSPAKKEVGANFIVTHDANQNNLVLAGIPMQWITTGITDLIESDRIVLILDVCHGGAVGSKGITRPLTVNPSTLNVGTGQLLLASSAQDQESWESLKYPNGVFTRQLIESLRSRGKMTTMSQAFKRLKVKVEEEVLLDREAIQTPILVKKAWVGGDLPLAVEPAGSEKALKSP
ncbi:MAG: tetratricopeptide repeat protein [Candidatus Obscuribacterales bacterium]